MYQPFDGEPNPSWVAVLIHFSSRRALLVAENGLVNTIMLFLRKSGTPEGNCLLICARILTIIHANLLRSAWWYDLLIGLDSRAMKVEMSSSENIDWRGLGLENPPGTVSCHHGSSCNRNTIPRWDVRMSLKRTTDRHEPKVTLQTLATHLNLAVGTISAALNDSPAARCDSGAYQAANS